MRRRDIIALTSAAVFLPRRTAIAQSDPARVIGYLSSASQAGYPPAYLAAFRTGLSEAGFAEGDKVRIEFRWAEDHYDRLPELAAELVRQKVNAIAATGGLVTALAAKKATMDIPIVFTMGDDPVAAGVVASFSRPGGNLSGVSFFVVELGAKLLGFAADLTPGTAPIAALANPNRPSYGPVRKVMEEAASTRHRTLVVLDAPREKDFDVAFATIARIKAGALLVPSDPLYLDHRDQIVALASKHAIPTIYAWRQYTLAGGLMSYGPNLADVYRQAGADVGKILGGQSPATLPVEQPTKFDLVINMKTARVLGLAMPPLLLAQADEVIE